MKKLSKSEQEVLEAIKGKMKLPTLGRTLKRHKRHDNAIASLKQKGLIEKGPDDVLRLKENG